MTRRIISDPEYSVVDVTNLPFKTTDLDAHQIAYISGGSIWDVIGDYISEEFGIDLPDVDVHPWSH